MAQVTSIGVREFSETRMAAEIEYFQRQLAKNGLPETTKALFQETIMGLKNRTITSNEFNIAKAKAQKKAVGPLIMEGAIKKTRKSRENSMRSIVLEGYKAKKNPEDIAKANNLRLESVRWYFWKFKNQ